MKKEKNKPKVLSFKYLINDLMRFLAIPAFLFFRPKKIYISDKAKKKIKGGALLISNHISVFDPMHLMYGIWYRRHHFIAMSELFDSKFSNWLFTKVFLCIKISREHFSFMTLKEIVQHLQNGELVSMFPEGRVNVEEGTKSFKSGMVLMALKSECPIIPVYIKRKKHWYSRLVFGIGEAINVRDFCKTETPTSNDIKNATLFLQEQEGKLAGLCGE